MKSIGTFFGGYPDENTGAQEQNPLIWAYFIGFVATWIVGAKVQQELFKSDEKVEEDDDEFVNFEANQSCCIPCWL